MIAIMIQYDVYKLDNTLSLCSVMTDKVVAFKWIHVY